MAIGVHLTDLYAANSCSSAFASIRGACQTAATSDNTNSTAATNGQSLHTRRRWFVAKNPSSRSRTQSWTPHGTPPKETAGHRAMHKKMQVRALWSRRAKALTSGVGLVENAHGAPLNTSVHYGAISFYRTNRAHAKVSCRGVQHHKSSMHQRYWFDGLTGKQVMEFDGVRPTLPFRNRLRPVRQ